LYKNLFNKEEIIGVRLADEFFDPSDLVSLKGSNMLDADFTEEEVKNALDSCYADGGSGPDGIPFFF
jgi:hypothetical protein